MNDIAEFCLVLIMRYLARAGHIASMIQCSRRHSHIAKKHGFYGYMIFASLAANRIARAYRFFSKYAGKTYATDEAIFSLILHPPTRQLSLTTTDPLVRFDVMNWSKFHHSWINDQPRSILTIQSAGSVQTGLFLIPRHFDIIRTITIVGANCAESISLEYRFATVHCTLPKTNYIVWEVNFPTLALDLDTLLLVIRLSGDAGSPQVQINGVFLNINDRNLIRQSNAHLNYFDATKHATKP